MSVGNTLEKDLKRKINGNLGIRTKQMRAGVKPDWKDRKADQILGNWSPVNHTPCPRATGKQQCPPAPLRWDYGPPAVGVTLQSTLPRECHAILCFMVPIAEMA